MKKGKLSKKQERLKECPLNNWQKEKAYLKDKFPKLSNREVEDMMDDSYQSRLRWFHI